MEHVQGTNLTMQTQVAQHSKRGRLGTNKLIKPDYSRTNNIDQLSKWEHTDLLNYEKNLQLLFR